LLQAAADKVEARMMTKTLFEELETMAGFRYNKHGIVASLALRRHVSPCDVLTYDWVHSALQAGMLTAEVEAIMGASGCTRPELQRFLADPRWEFPQRSRAKDRQLHRVFDPRRVNDDKPEVVKATCSELLGLFGLLRFYMTLKLTDDPTLSNHLISFNAACHVIDLILACKRGLMSPSESADRLLQASEHHLASHLHVYGDAHVRPKHHWMLDIGEQIRRDGLVLDALVIERTHLAVKSIAQHIKNTSVYERSVLKGMTTVLFQGAGAGGDCELVGPVSVLPGVEEDVTIADTVRVFAVDVTVNDVVCRGDAAGVVVACAQRSHVCCLFVAPLVVIKKLTEHSDECQKADRLVLWPAKEVVHALAWRSTAACSVIVVRR
jgi:hypothetical protein